MFFGKPAEALDQPFGGEVGRGADGERAAALTLQQPLGAERDPVECVADDGEIVAARLGDDQPLPLAGEQLEPERFLERFDLLADSALCDVQFFSGAGETLAACGGLEGLQGVQRWEAARHLPKPIIRKSHPGYLAKLPLSTQ